MFLSIKLFVLLAISYCLASSISPNVRRNVANNTIPSYSFNGKTPNFNMTNPEAFHKRSFFYAGGSYVFDNSTGKGGTYFRDAMYVEQLSPELITQPFPIVMVHGGGPSGTSWLQTPDGRQGWASYFLEKGYEIYITDLPYIGRSVAQQSLQYQDPVTVENAELGFSQNKGTAWPQAINHTQFPGLTGTKGEVPFDNFYKAQITIPSDEDLTVQAQTWKASSAELLRQIGPSFLVGHSLGGQNNWLTIDAAKDLVVGAVQIEPASAPYTVSFGDGNSALMRYGLSNATLVYDPPVDPSSSTNNLTVKNIPAAPNQISCQLQQDPAKQLVNLNTTNILFLTSEAGIHAQYDNCTVLYLRQAGVDKYLNWTQLQDIGIHGNGHFMHLELNNLDIAAYVEDWLVTAAQTGIQNGKFANWNDTMALRLRAASLR